MVKLIKEIETDADILGKIFHEIKFIIFLVQLHDPRTKIQTMCPFYNEYSNRTVGLRRILRMFRLSDYQAQFPQL